MKSSFFSKIIMLATAILITTSTYAAAAVHKGSLQVTEAVQVNGKQLPPGDYTVTWEGEGPNIDLHIARGHKEIATAPAKVVQLDKKASQDTAEVTTSGGARELTAMRFAGQRYEVDVVSSASARAGDGVK